MKKSYYCLFLILLFVLMLSACGNSADKSRPEVPVLAENTNAQSVESPGGKVPNILKSTGDGISGDGQETSAEEKTDNSSKETGSVQVKKITVKAGGQKFQAVLYDNETVRALQKKLPMTLDMEELNGNEKFHYLDEELPTDSENVGNIRAGDIMLFGSDCLVLFYEDFSTSYSYTKIGHIEEEEAFVNALSEGTVEVTFEAASPS